MTNVHPAHLQSEQVTGSENRITPDWHSRTAAFFFVPAVCGIKWHFYLTETLMENTKEFECTMRPKLIAMGQRDIKVWGLPEEEGRLLHTER